MEQQKFDKSTAAAIVAMLVFPESVEVKDDGVFVSEGFRTCSPDGKAFDWTPADDMDWPGAPNAITAPALPIPFNAGELAAFMLDGAGAGIQDCLNRRIGYPLDDEALEHFRKRFRMVREALRSAYAVAEQAQSVVGEYDYEEAKRAYDLREQLDNAEGQANQIEGVFEPGISNDEASQRRERAVASNAELKARVTKVNAEVDAKWAAWRAAMVRQILFTEPQAATAPSPAPMETASPSGETAGPLPLTTGDIAYCFNGLRWDEKGWKTSLGNKPNWLEACIVIPGRRGVSETRWNPVLIGAAIVQQGHVKPRSARAVFQRNPLLTPWLDAWKTYEADNLDAD